MNSYKKRIFGSALGRRFKSTGAAIAMLASFAVSPSMAAVFDVRAYGAKGDGTAKDTAAIQAAVDAASAADGGTFAPVEVPAEERALIEKAIDGNRNLLY